MATDILEAGIGPAPRLSLRNGEHDVFDLHRRPDGRRWLDAGEQGVGEAGVCTVMRDGLHVVLADGRIAAFYFDAVPLAGYLRVVAALRARHADTPGRLEVLDA